MQLAPLDSLPQISKDLNKMKAGKTSTHQSILMFRIPDSFNWDERASKGAESKGTIEGNLATRWLAFLDLTVTVAAFVSLFRLNSSAHRFMSSLGCILNTSQASLRGISMRHSS
jgi:hypothetical protein